MWICIAPCHDHTFKALRYGTRSQGISQSEQSPRILPVSSVYLPLQGLLKQSIFFICKQAASRIVSHNVTNEIIVGLSVVILSRHFGL